MLRLLNRQIKNLFLIVPFIICVNMGGMAKVACISRHVASIACGVLNTLFPRDILYWDWSHVNLNDPDFFKKLNIPENVKIGVADSDYQVAGPYGKKSEECTEGEFFSNDWTEWEKGEGNIAQGHKIGHACDQWNRYEEDLELMKENGVQIYRLSIEWSKVEPRQREFNQESIDHYKNVIATAKHHGIEVTVCCWHHTLPLWVANEGGWENPETINLFTNYACYVFKELQKDDASYVDSWMTLNEPVGYAMGSYFVQDNLKHPPAKHDLKTCGQVVVNLLQAHCECYRAFKEIDSKVTIGFSHVIQPIDPYHRFNIVERIGSYIFDYLVNDAALDFFLTGQFKWGYPWKTLVSVKNSQACNCIDKLWVNYYSHSNICMRWKNILNPKEFVKPRPREDKNEVLTDNGQIIYPEGLYRAIEKCSRLNVRIAIGECGLADNNDTLKSDFIKKHLYVVSEAIKRGYNLEGIYWWTFKDNWEWAKGYTESFGLFHVDFETQERTPYAGSGEFLEFMRSRSNDSKSS